MTKDQVIAMAQVCMTDKFTRQYSTPLYCFNDSDLERFATLVRSSAQQAAPAAPTFDLNCTCGAVWEVRGTEVELVHTAAPAAQRLSDVEIDAHCPDVWSDWRKHSRAIETAFAEKNGINLGE